MELNNKFTWKDIEGFFGASNIYDNIIRHSDKSDTIVEIGCHEGKSTAYLISRAKLTGRNPKVLCIDNFIAKYENLEESNKNMAVFVNNLTKTGVINHVNIMRSSGEVASYNVEDQSIFAVIFEHKHNDRSSILTDIKNWMPKIKQNGFIAGYDLHNNFEYIEKILKIAGIKKFETTKQPECTSWIAKKPKS